MAGNGGRGGDGAEWGVRGGRLCLHSNQRTQHTYATPTHQASPASEKTTERASLSSDAEKTQRMICYIHIYP